MLKLFFTDTLSLGLAQSIVAALLALIVVWVARQQHIHIERETLIGLLRAFVQIVAVGSILILLMKGPLWTSAIVLLVMMIAAAATSAKRAGSIPGAFLASLIGIGIGSGSLILVFTLLGLIDSVMVAVVPVGSMLVFNAMNTNGVVLNRFEAEVKGHAGHIEAGLALGASSKQVIVPYAQAAVHAGMIPRIDSLHSLGIVWIPGLMTGMVLSGGDPIYAAIYQFVTMAMVFITAGLTAVITSLFIRKRIFSSAEQLLLRPGSKDTQNIKSGEGKQRNKQTF